MMNEELIKAMEKKYFDVLSGTDLELMNQMLEEVLKIKDSIIDGLKTQISNWENVFFNIKLNSKGGWADATYYNFLQEKIKELEKGCGRQIERLTHHGIQVYCGDIIDKNKIYCKDCLKKSNHKHSQENLPSQSGEGDASGKRLPCLDTEPSDEPCAPMDDAVSRIDEGSSKSKGCGKWYDASRKRCGWDELCPECLKKSKSETEDGNESKD